MAKSYGHERDAKTGKIKTVPLDPKSRAARVPEYHEGTIKEGLAARVLGKAVDAAVDRITRKK